jgi:2-polyprenyl-3-methyl-5-hydroxy-6-metoxy-1,4-benzoquinol methylase
MKSVLFSLLVWLLGSSSSSSQRGATAFLLPSIKSHNHHRYPTVRFVSMEKEPLLFVDETSSSSPKHDQVSKYYGSTLQTSDDLATNACCTAGAPPAYIQECLDKIHPTVLSKYYGCGLCLPCYDLSGLTILDLGCGAGRDVYIASQLVGKEGRVVGVDMTQEQLKVANEFRDYHAQQFGFRSNVEFHKGYLEHLDQVLALEPNSFDVIISNCVLNLCQDKEAVLRHCLSLLKEGGEMYFSDVYANRRVPQVLKDDEVLWGECLSGALYWNDFENLARKVGFADPRLVEDSPISIRNRNVEQLIHASGGLEFYSATYRLWKLPELEPHCEDYGQAVVYKGTLPRFPSGWLLDKHHYFVKNKVHPVCGNTYNMLAKTPALQQHFEFVGNWDTHFGIFEGCGSSIPFDSTSSGGGGESSSSSGKGASTNKASCC